MTRRPARKTEKPGAQYGLLALLLIIAIFCALGAFFSLAVNFVFSTDFTWVQGTIGLLLLLWVSNLFTRR